MEEAKHVFTETFVFEFLDISLLIFLQLSHELDFGIKKTVFGLIPSLLV